MADAVEECVYDYIIIAPGATMDTLTLPPPGDHSWRGLPLRQVQRIGERDHMVLYLTCVGASYPFKLKEARDDLSLMLYERRGECDCVVKRMPKGPTVLNVQYRLTSRHLYFQLLALTGRRICGFSWPTDQPLRAATVLNNLELETTIANEMNTSKQNVIHLIGSRSNHAFTKKD
ncbi:unnamed protein product [Cladocopium goreaui]|uniref:Uncharacterized protein n=1 Tax=Cladocopium goreaui TaxID=2562237 RepID=A0A9P1FWA2_9DINO|nr:unnamed protein product [Cladocopium goreaui]